MNATSTIAAPVERIPFIPPRTAKTVVKALKTDRTVSAIHIRVDSGVYTDEQFHADLKKASKWIDAMEGAALKEHAEGKTRKLP
jgi:hypothetical protein